MGKEMKKIKNGKYRYIDLYYNDLYGLMLTIR
jgi:hypothetical protein